MPNPNPMPNLKTNFNPQTAALILKQRYYYLAVTHITET